MHLTTNVLVELSPDGRQATATSKVLTPKPDGTAGVSRYEDSLVLTAVGRQIARHVVDPTPGPWRLPGCSAE
jgi:hypothetical protein